MTAASRVFISYSHSDKAIAKRVAEALNSKGVRVWWDDWEIRPGDSLIAKIFKEGLTNVGFFLVLLSKASTASSWVQHELDSAMVNRLSGITRIMPVVVESCEIPTALRPLKWVDLSKDVEAGLTEIVDTVHGVDRRPPVGDVPRYVTELAPSMGGLTRIASTVGLATARATVSSEAILPSLTGHELSELCPALNTTQINDAVDELKEFGLVKTTNWFGTAPYAFGRAEPTYSLYLHFADCDLGYDPVEDVKSVASAINAQERIDGPALSALVKHMSVQRINRAVSYLDDYGMIEVLRTLGTAPYMFRWVEATRKTRQFLAEQ